MPHSWLLKHWKWHGYSFPLASDRFGLHVLVDVLSFNTCRDLAPRKGIPVDTHTHNNGILSTFLPRPIPPDSFLPTTTPQCICQHRGYAGHALILLTNFLEEAHKVPLPGSTWSAAASGRCKLPRSHLVSGLLISASGSQVSRATATPPERSINRDGEKWGQHRFIWYHRPSKKSLACCSVRFCRMFVLLSQGNEPMNPFAADGQSQSSQHEYLWWTECSAEAKDGPTAVEVAPLQLANAFWL